MNNDYGNPFSVAFNMLKIKYAEYDKSIDSSDFISLDDKVNVFINFETILNFLTRIKDIDKKLIIEKNFPIVMISDALNLCAHYKRFFKQNGLQTRIFLYYTDLESDKFNLNDINDEYRSYYLTKYKENPRYAYLGESLINRIIPEISTICEFIDSVYFIKATNFDSSMIPYMVSEMDKTYKNFIITGDPYDTIYQRMNKFMVHYMKRSVGHSSINYTPSTSLNEIFNDAKFTDDIPKLFEDYNFYNILLGSNGDKLRSIDGVKGLGAKGVAKYITNELSSGNINKSTENIELILRNISDTHRERLLSNCKCMDIKSIYSNLDRYDIFSVEKQMVDRFDNNSLIKLNNGRFSNHQLMLEQLTM